MSDILARIQQAIKSDRYYTDNFANDGERFIAWYLRNIYLRTSLQARDDITDGADDKQIDAIIVDDEKRQVIIIQGKFFSSSLVDHKPLHEVLAAWLYIQNLADLQENGNKKLKVKLQAVEEALKDDYDVVFELVTTGKLTEAAKQDINTFQATISDFNTLEASIILVDESVLQTKWDEALKKDLPKLSYTFTLEEGKFLSLEVANFKTVLAAIRLSDCLNLPGLNDGSLFRKNVRQSLGLTNKVNKGLKQTINGEAPNYFFLYHNGITTLCEKLNLDPITHQLQLEGLSVVNGCQSLTTILACSVKAKQAKDAYILFRFYEIPQHDLADKISIYTNSQSAVKPRDLRSNDKRVIALKRAYEDMYPDGYLITKRGEERPANRNEAKTIDISSLAKCLMAWHCQRPNIAYNENKLFDKYFEQLFQSDYPPTDILALNEWARHIERRWKQNDLGLNEALAANPSYSKFHLLFAIQTCFSVASHQIDKVPTPSATGKVLNDLETVDLIINLAARCYNYALHNAMRENQERNKVFSPQNWLKAKDSFLKIQNAVEMYLDVLDLERPSGNKDFRKSLIISPDKFTLRWSAD